MHKHSPHAHPGVVVVGYKPHIHERMDILCRVAGASQMHANTRVGPINQSITLAEEVGTMRTLSRAMAGVCSSGVPDVFPEKTPNTRTEGK
jgi:hypothetical protein